MDVELISAIAYGIAVTITNILTIISNRKKTKECSIANNTIKELESLVKLPDQINEAEAQVGAENGSLKKTIVLQAQQIDCQNNTTKFDLEKQNAQIEKILSTPQKKIKGEENGKENEIETQNRCESIYQHSEEN